MNDFGELECTRSEWRDVLNDFSKVLNLFQVEFVRQRGGIVDHRINC